MFAIVYLDYSLHILGNFNIIFSLKFYFSCDSISLEINCRKVADRPRDPAKWSEIADVVSALSVPVIANGDVFEHDDFQRIKSATGKYCLIVFLIISNFIA